MSCFPIVWTQFNFRSGISSNVRRIIHLDPFGGERLSGVSSARGVRRLPWVACMTPLRNSVENSYQWWDAGRTTTITKRREFLASRASAHLLIGERFQTLFWHGIVFILNKISMWLMKLLQLDTHCVSFKLQSKTKLYTRQNSWPFMMILLHLLQSFAPIAFWLIRFVYLVIVDTSWWHELLLWWMLCHSSFDPFENFQVQKGYALMILSHATFQRHYLYVSRQWSWVPWLLLLPLQVALWTYR